MDIFYMYAEMGNDKGTEMQLIFQDLPIPSMFVTTPKVGATGLILTAANHVVITQKLWVLAEQCQALAQIVWLRQNCIPQTWLLRTGPHGFDNRASDLHQLSGVVNMRELHSLMSRLNITTSKMNCILEGQEDHMEQHTEDGDVVPSDGEDKC